LKDAGSIGKTIICTSILRQQAAAINGGLEFMKKSITKVT